MNNNNNNDDDDDDDNNNNDNNNHNNNENLPSRGKPVFMYFSPILMVSMRENGLIRLRIGIIGKPL